MIILEARRRAVLASLALIVLAACGGSSPGAPGVTPSTPPTSSPGPTAPPVVSSQSVCERMGDGVYAAPCSKTASRYYDAVDGAIEKLIKKQPHLFDLNDVAGPGSFRVLEPDEYYQALGAALGETGHCAQMDTEKAFLQVKADNEFSEKYQVLTNKGFIARGDWIYRTSCMPASFPVAAPDAIAYIRVAMYGFDCLPGTPMPERGGHFLPMSCDAHVTATPKDANGRDVPSKIHGSDIRWVFKKGEELVGVRGWAEPFNLTLMPRSPGFFKICAVVQDYTGCVGVEITP